MARRIKEEPEVHRARIAGAAKELFEVQGIEKTSVSEIAERAGYSKATIYVYFENKEEIVSYLVLKSMQILKNEIMEYTDRMLSKHDNFILICGCLAKYNERYPMYFKLLSDTINVDFSGKRYFGSERDTYLVGEEISTYLKELFDLGDDGFLRIFTAWSAICGLITMASNKNDYIQKQSGLSSGQLLQQAFELLSRSLIDS